MSSTARKLLAPALLLTCMAGSFSFNAYGAQWFWAQQLPVAAVLAAGALVAWSLLLRAQLKSAPARR